MIAKSVCFSSVVSKFGLKDSELAMVHSRNGLAPNMHKVIAWTMLTRIADVA